MTAIDVTTVGQLIAIINDQFGQIVDRLDNLSEEVQQLQRRIDAIDGEDYEEYVNDPEYQGFVEEQAKHCRCASGPCDGVLAGGTCDEMYAELKDMDGDQ
jgi:hypothetical protein